MVICNWSEILTNRKNVSAVAEFANGEISGRQFYSRFVGTQAGGEVRSLLRNNGVNNARRLARKALTRRENAVF